MERPGDKKRRLGDGAPLPYATTNLLAAITCNLHRGDGVWGAHNCSAAMGEGGEKSRSDLRDGVRCAWAKPSLDAITTSNARMASGSPET